MNSVYALLCISMHSCHAFLYLFHTPSTIIIHSLRFIKSRFRNWQHYASTTQHLITCKYLLSLYSFRCGIIYILKPRLLFRVFFGSADITLFSCIVELYVFNDSSIVLLHCWTNDLLNIHIFSIMNYIIIFNYYNCDSIKCYKIVVVISVWDVWLCSSSLLYSYYCKLFMQSICLWELIWWNYC